MHLVFVGAIVASVVAVLSAFQPAGWVWAFSSLWIFLLGILNYDHHRDRVAILDGLKRRDNALIYTKLVDATLGALRRMLSPSDAENDPMPDKGWLAQSRWLVIGRARDPEDLRQLQANTMSWPVMDAALTVAVIYPWLLLLCQWGTTGTDVSIGSTTILFAEERAWPRAVLVLPIVALALVRCLASISQERTFESTTNRLFFLIVVVLVALELTGALPHTGALTGVLALSLTFSLALRFRGAFAFAFIVTLAFFFTFIGTGILAVAFIFTLAFSLAFAVIYSCSQGIGGRAYAIFVVVTWVSLVTFSSLSDQALSADYRVFLFVLGLLPLINAVFDYFSYGITLGLIRYGRRQRNLLTGLVWIIDGVVAVLLLIGLGLGLSGTIALINHLAGQEFIALRPIFDDLKTSEGRAGYTWLTLTLLSTLVPTLVHLVLVFLSAFTWVPQRFKLWIAREIEDNETGDLATLRGSIVAATLGALWAALVVCGLSAIWMFITAYIEPAGLAILWMVEHIALWLDWVASPDAV